MKNAFKVLFIVFISAVVYFFSIKKDKMNESGLLNIEALASPENNTYKCIGIGSIDCPLDHVKVYQIE